MAVKVKYGSCVWLIFALARILWTWLPQTGYIHPDEFFQAPEITAGDLLGVASYKPWEFNETFPVRSVVFPYIMTGIPFICLKLAANYQMTFLSAENLVIAARMMFCLSSFVVDFVVWKICGLLAIDPSFPLCVLSTSFVMLVFYTRPFSNTTESVLFAVLLLLVISENCSQPGSSKTRRFLKMFSAGVVVTAGFWNRPTFLSFAFLPLVGWMYCLCSKNNVRRIKDAFLSFVPGILAFFIGVIPTSLFIILCDSVYFGFLAKNQLVFTPLNFLFYNLNSESLKEHGIHSRITHLVVNMPLLFGPLAIVLFGLGVRGIYKQDYQRLFRFPHPGGTVDDKHEMKKKGSDINYGRSASYTILVISIIFPVCILSIMPHQEPRFIIPVLTPLSICFAHLICGRDAFRLLTVIWVLWNVVGCIIFGILHQGGMYPCMRHLQMRLAKDVRSTPTPTSYNIIFFHTYMPPQHLLIWPKHQNKVNTESRKHNLAIYDMAGITNEALVNKTLSIMKELKEKKLKSGQSYVVLVVAPSTVKLQLPGLHLMEQFSPHLSFEDPPQVNSNSASLCSEKSVSQRYMIAEEQIYQYCSADNEQDLITTIRKELSLNLYEVTS